MTKSAPQFSLLIVLLALFPCLAGAVAPPGTISGMVVDDQQISLPGAKVRLVDGNGHTLSEGTSTATGTFQFLTLASGDYVLVVTATGFEPSRTTVHVVPGGNTPVQIALASRALAPSGPAVVSGQEMVVRVSAHKRAHDPAPSSHVQITKERVQELPQGQAISLPKLVASTSPGVVSGPFGQMFIRGNHADIQYQIDGVQLPDSTSNTFGEAFSPRNIEQMELITGGLPAEYGLRTAAVMNITTKTGPETPGGSAEINYGSYNTYSPIANFGGSLGEGNVHYYLSGNYRGTDRGIDTPQPVSDGNLTQGGTDAVHDQSHSNNEFLKLDWIAGNSDKLTLVGFHAYNFYQIPNYPQSFGPGDPIFQTGYSDPWGNGPYRYVPYNTNDTQAERNAYVQAVWKHTFSPHSFLQVASYWKYSSVLVGNDPANDLAGQSISGQTPSSFAEDRQTNNVGLKVDYTLRWSEKHLIKSGVQLLTARATGSYSIQVPGKPAFSDASPNSGQFESVYLQDEYTIARPLILNAGLRFDATQFQFSGVSPSDYALEPRLGLTWLATDSTKLHGYYGRLFEPAPVENLRAAFSTVGGGQSAPYDIKAEKDDYFELGVAETLPFDQTMTVNAYYKSATNMLDDAQLLNTSMAQPYNFATGYAYGVEASLQGQITESLSSYVNYSYDIAKGKGISGGIFAFNPANLPPNQYQFLDHVQLHTVNGGLTYHWKGLWATGQALFGSGLRTGLGNTQSLPSHLSFDTSVGYSFASWSDSWWAKTKVSLDVLNITNNVYPITIANGFNGSHYAVGRQFFVHLVKDI